MQKQAHPRTIPKWPVRAGIAIATITSLSCAPLTGTITRAEPKSTSADSLGIDSSRASQAPSGSSADTLKILQNENNNYILEIARKGRDSTVKDKAKVAKFISNRLKELEHINPIFFANTLGASELEEVVTMSVPTTEELNKFDEVQLLQVYLLLKALESPEFRARIGKELELDTKDTTCEHGGVLRLGEKGNVLLEMVPSASIGESPFPGMDLPPDMGYSYDVLQTYSRDLLFRFHFHALKPDQSFSSSLSGGDWIFGGAGGAVFSRIDGKKFNLDVGLSFVDAEGKIVKVNLDLGVYSY